MFNFSSSEIVFLLLLALIVLGPEKLPDAVRKFGKTYAEFKKVTTGFQSELRSALDEPMREMRDTADVLKKAANFDSISDTVKPTSGSMEAATPAPQAVQPPFKTGNQDESKPAEVTETASPTDQSEAAAAPSPAERPPGPAFHSAAPPRIDPTPAATSDAAVAAQADAPPAPAQEEPPA